MPNTDTPRILIVDDRPENLLAMDRLLSGLDVELFKAASGNEALTCMIHHDFAVVLLDVQMPEMDGFEVAALMRDREATKDTPIIFVTAISKDERHVFKGAEAGAVDFLYKPIDPYILKSKVNALLRLCRQRYALESEIKERRLAEQKLHESEERLQTIIRALPAGVMLIDAETRSVVDVNPAALKMMGATREEIIGSECRGNVCPAGEGECPVGDLGTPVENSETLLLGPGGKSVPIIKTMTPLTLDGREHYLESFVDISIRKRAEENVQKTNATLTEALQRERNISAELEVAREQMEVATRSKSEFLANMSHEIRTPMTAILGFTENMLDPDSTESERLNALYTVRRNGEHLLQIINDILDISKIEAGKFEVEAIRCSPIQLVADVQALMTVRAEQKEIILRTEYIGAVPETILSDPTRLRQILVNLIGNAIKFTETGVVRLIVRFVDGDRTHAATREKLDARPSLMQFEVLDSGIGMTDAQVETLFKAFSQADTSTTRRFGGTGLGLDISKRLADMLGGDITVQSKIGEGSSFRATVTTGSLDGVKMVSNPMSAAIVRPEDAVPRGSESRKIACRILLVEDGLDNQRLIAHVLRKAGASVTIKENGKLAYDAALSARYSPEPFDVILMDMQMPVMDGYEATGLLRQRGYTGPIIALTAHAMTSDRQRCLDAGCDDYASKPVDRHKLIETIRKYLPDASAGATPTSAGVNTA